MKKTFQIILTLLLTDFCLFPVALNALPTVNFKTILAGVGLLTAFMDMLVRRRAIISRTLFDISLYAGLLSFIAYISTVYNGTNDNTLVTYVASAWVWFFAAYTVIRYMRHTHGEASLTLIGRYLVVVCVMQCILAVMIDRIPSFAAAVNRIFYIESASRLMMAHRLYGIGAELDIAGIRFSCVLVILMHLLLKDEAAHTNRLTLWYWLGFLIITVVGCMIARTTIVGTGLGLAYYAIETMRRSGRHGLAYSMVKGMVVFMFILAIAVVVSVVLYSTDTSFREHLEFGFEGFFNYFESGSFETGSTNTLQTMYVFPENTKTWIIGDGLFFDNGHTYMWTDVGYIRFIFYFGLIGLTSFILLYVYMMRRGRRFFPEDKTLFFLLFLVNMIVWLKVATDTFVVFMFLLNAGIQKEGEAVV
ncbi:MAG: hypothetical protein K6F98_00685 [Bacteroidales bacterium]|nr:hypothetical protein [Bacteroidales bacterium]